MIPVKLRQAVTCQIEAIGGEEEDAAAAAAAAAEQQQDPSYRMINLFLTVNVAINIVAKTV